VEQLRNIALREATVTTGDVQHLTQVEIDALARNVEDWSRGLTSKERAFMAEVIVRAANSEPADVRGYGFGFYQPMYETPANVVSSDDSLPAESISLNFSKILSYYHEQK